MIIEMPRYEVISTGHAITLTPSQDPLGAMNANDHPGQPQFIEIDIKPIPPRLSQYGAQEGLVEDDALWPEKFQLCRIYGVWRPVQAGGGNAQGPTPDPAAANPDRGFQGD